MTTVSTSVHALLDRSRHTLESACRTTDACERYLDAHLGALRAAAALLAAIVPARPRAKPQNVWQALPGAVPELGEWAGFFAGSSATRSVIDRGGWVTAREADDMLRQAEMFLEIVQDRLGVPMTTPLPDVLTPVRSVRPPHQAAQHQTAPHQLPSHQTAPHQLPSPATLARRPA